MASQFAGAVHVGAEGLGQAPESAAVIELAQMGDLMGDDIIHHEAGRQDQAPGEIEHAVGRAAAPAAAGIADADAPDPLAQLIGLLQRPALELPARLQLQPILDPAGQMLRPAGDMDLPGLAPDDAAVGLAVADAMLDPEIGDRDAMQEGQRLGHAREPLLDPALVGEGEAPPILLGRPGRQDDHDAAAMVEADDDPARPLVLLEDQGNRPVAHRQQIAADDGRLAAGAGRGGGGLGHGPKCCGGPAAKQGTRWPIGVSS